MTVHSPPASTTSFASFLQQEPDAEQECVIGPLPSSEGAHVSANSTHLDTPSLEGALEDVTPSESRAGSLAIQSEVLEQDTPRDPFEDSALHGFGLSSVGAALSVKSSMDGPSDKEQFLWSIVHTGGEGLNHPHHL